MINNTTHTAGDATPPFVRREDQPTWTLSELVRSLIFGAHFGPPTKPLTDREIRPIFINPPTRVASLFVYSQHAQQTLPAVVKERLKEVKTAADLAHLNHEVAFECNRFNYMMRSWGELNSINSAPYDYSSLAKQWKSLETLVNLPWDACIEKRFDLLSELNPTSNFEGPQNILDQMHLQFRNTVCTLFEFFDVEQLWKETPKETLLQALRDMSKLADKFDPNAGFVESEDAIRAAAEQIKQGRFEPLLELVKSQKCLSHQLRIIYVIAKANEENMVSMLSRQFDLKTT